MDKYQNHNYSAEDIAYMQSLSAAVVEKSPRYMIRIVGIMGGALFAILLWMSWAEIDIVVRGEGKVVPTSQIQKIQNLEGGVVSEIYIQEGDFVDVNQPLIKISDVAFESSFVENKIKILELKSRISRLTAEALDQPFVRDEEVDALDRAVQDSEESLYDSNKAQLEETIRILKEQVSQRRNELTEMRAKVKQGTKTLELLQEEIDIKQPLAKKRIIGEVEFLQLKQRHAEASAELENSKIQVPRVASALKEAENKIQQNILDFRNKAKKELNETTAEVARITKTQDALSDRVQRTTLRSPVKGTVTRLHVNTIGGVINPGNDIVEIVPIDDALLVEIKVKPADIADIALGQKTRIKFSAYDFAIYGSLGGEVIFVSADTVTNQQGETYYVVRIKPEAQHLGHVSQKLLVKVGMTVNVDVLTSKRTILQYVMKPIYRGLGNALGEK